MSHRIAIVSTCYPRDAGDASGHFVRAEVQGLVRAGHDVHVFAPGVGQSEDGAAHLHWLGDHGAFGWPGALPRLKENPLRMLGASEFVLRAARAVRVHGPFEHLQAHFLVPSGWPIATLALGASARTELEIVGHGSDVRVFCRLPKQLRKHIARGWLARRVKLRVTSQELAALLGQASRELLPALHVAASPIDMSGVPDRLSARARLGFSESAAIALVVSRLVPSKRVLLALQALTLLDGVSVVVVGDGPELATLSARFPSVRFTGRVPRADALCYIAAADVLVSASAEEGAPTVVREARQLGVPVVAVAAGDLALWAERDPGLLLARA